MKPIHFFFIASAASLIIQSQAATTIIVNFAPNGQNGNGINEANFAQNGDLFSNGNIPGANPVSIGAINGPGGGGASTVGLPQFNSFTLTDTVSGATGEFDIVLSLTSNSTAAVNQIDRGGVGAAGVGNTLIDPTESITVSFEEIISTGAPVVGGSFEFTGFSSVFIGNATDTEAVSVNGINVTGLTTPGTIAGQTPTDLAALSSTITLEGVTGGVALSGVVADFEFVPIPEPSSFILMGLGGFLGCFTRRRCSI